MHETLRVVTMLCYLAVASSKARLLMPSCNQISQLSAPPDNVVFRIQPLGIHEGIVALPDLFPSLDVSKA